MSINLHIKMKKVSRNVGMLTFPTSKIWHHTHSTVTSSYTNSKGTHAAYEDVLFHENDELQTEKIDKNKR